MTDPMTQLDARRKRYEQARQQRRAALNELKAALRAADRARVNGYPPRSELIARSGLPRRTAYQALNDQQEVDQDVRPSYPALDDGEVHA